MGMIHGLPVGPDNSALGSTPAPPGAPRRRALIGQQHGNPLLRRSEAVESLPAIGVRLVEAAEEIIGLCRCDPSGDASFGKLGAQRLYLLRSLVSPIAFPIGAGAFLLDSLIENPKLLAQRLDGTFERPNCLRSVRRSVCLSV